MNDWTTGCLAWDEFVARNPCLGYRPGHWAFHNFLRLFRSALLAQDAIRLARNKHWIAHVERFCSVAFECATLVPEHRRTARAAHCE